MNVTSRRRILRGVGPVAFALVLLEAAGAPDLPSPRLAPIESASGQFVVFAAPPARRAPWLTRLAENTNYILLEPTLLAVSCERIKQKLCDQLGVTSPWRGKVYLNLHPASSPAEGVTVVAQKSPGGWEYLVALPDILSRDRFVRAIVQVLLSEIANRSAGVHPAEVPRWLVDGLGGELRALNEVELFLPPPTLTARGLAVSRLLVSARWSDPGEQARQAFRSRPPLSFEQLSWPAESQLTGEAGEVFGRSALLFVDALLHLPDGPVCLRAMVEDLPRHYNWQMAFLDAFRPRFQTALDVEKWWALQVVYLTGHDLFDRWTPEESRKRLDAALRFPVEVRTAGGEMPLRGEVNLQTLIREWPLPRQARVLQDELADLDLLRLRVAPETGSLVEDYRRVVQVYWDKRGLSAQLLGKGPPGPVADRVAQQTIAQLNALDLRREALRTPSDKADQTATQPPAR